MQSQPQSVQQINLSYDSHQDRLLLRAAIDNDQEVRVWITYRVARQIFAVMNREAHLPVALSTQATTKLLESMQSPEAATRQFEQEAEAVHDLDGLDFDTAYKERTSVVSDQELLAIETRFVSINDHLHHMQVVCAGGANVNVNLNKELVLAMSRMLQMASKDAGWLLPAEKEPEAVSSIVMQVPTEKQVLH